MSCKYSKVGVSRRAFLSGTAAAGVVAASPFTWAAEEKKLNSQIAAAQASIAAPKGKMGIPGPYPGRVIEVHHPGSLKDSRRVLYQRRNRAAYYTDRDADVVQAMIDRGMKDLVGSDDATEAWRNFFASGDRVGIKVVPVGAPDSISSHEVVDAVVKGLNSAGVRNRDILLVERYKRQFLRCAYDKAAPSGVGWECSSFEYGNAQLDIDGKHPTIKGASYRGVVGYDRDVYRELPYCQTPDIHDPNDDRRFRSHLSKIVTQKVDKIINIPVLKDHGSAGVTLALKNLSHGFVNNVARSHVVLFREAEEMPAWASLNQCNSFIPAMVALPQIREKVVLNIMDGLVGTWEGGPGGGETWQYKSLFFATDPVAMDHIGWEIIDAKRAQVGWPGVAEMGHTGKMGYKRGDKPSWEQFHSRHPQHIPLAAMLGLGVFDKEKITHQRIDLA